MQWQGFQLHLSQSHTNRIGEEKSVGISGTCFFHKIVGNYQLHLFATNSALKGRKPAFRLDKLEKQVLSYRCSSVVMKMIADICGRYRFLRRR